MGGSKSIPETTTVLKYEMDKFAKECLEDVNDLKAEIRKENNTDCTCNTRTTVLSKLNKFHEKWEDRYNNMLIHQPKQSHSDQCLPKKAVSVLVQLYCRRNDYKVEPILSEIENMLTAHLASQNTNLKLEKLAEPSSINFTVPGLVICINTSRLGSDASTALEGVNVSPKIALVVLHHRRPQALPQESSDAILRQQNYNVGAIFDMAYLSDSGFYDCKMNTKAFDSIAKFIMDNK